MDTQQRNGSKYRIWWRCKEIILMLFVILCTKSYTLHRDNINLTTLYNKEYNYANELNHNYQLSRKVVSLIDIKCDSVDRIIIDNGRYTKSYDSQYLKQRELINKKINEG